MRRQKKKKTEVKWYKHRVYGCKIGDDEKKKAHLNEISKHYKFNSKSKDLIASERET